MIMTGSAKQNNTISGGSRGLEVCLRNIQAEPFKIYQPTYSYLCYFDDRDISTSEFVIYCLLSHHILIPNE